MHCPPFKSESSNDILHPSSEPVRLTAHSLSMLDQWSFRTIENEEWEKRHTHESGTTKEERAQLWILPFFTVCGVEEPN
jgi:hypothetical protein